LGKKERPREYRRSSSSIWRKGKYRSKTIREVKHSKKEELRKEELLEKYTAKMLYS